MATVNVIYEFGYQIGPEPWTTCEQCLHEWGDHVLENSLGYSVSAGFYSCPSCPCRGLWDIAENPEAMFRDLMVGLENQDEEG